VKYSKESRQDPNYMSIRDRASNEPPPPSLPPRSPDPRCDWAHAWYVL